MASYDLDDSSVVVVIGSGAGGGTLSNELAQQGADEPGTTCQIFAGFEVGYYLHRSYLALRPFCRRDCLWRGPAAWPRRNGMA